MAAYTVINELQSMDFHDSFLESLRMEGTQLRMVFTNAIIIGHSRPDMKGRVPCSVNSGADRYAFPLLVVKLEGFQIRSVLQGGYQVIDDQGNILNAHLPHKLSPEEYGKLPEMVIAEEGSPVMGLFQDTETGIYTLALMMNADADYYEIEFTAETAIAEFEEFGREAWYLDDEWETQTEDS